LYESVVSRSPDSLRVEKDTPEPPDMGKVIEIPEVGGLFPFFQLRRKAAGKLGPAVCVRKMTYRLRVLARACKSEVGPSKPRRSNDEVGRRFDE